jgi:flagellar motor switch protein FliG
MSKRAVLLLKEEIEYLGSVPLSSIKQVRREIIRIVRLLINSGEIDWSPT